MTGFMKRLFAVVASMPLAFGGAATAATHQVATPDQMAWEEAVNTNTLEAFAAFAMQYPDSDHASEARARLVTEAMPADAVDVFETARDVDHASSPDFVPSSIMVV